MTGTMVGGQLQNKLKTTGTTITWEIEDIWNLTFEGVSSSYFIFSDHALYLHARRYETSIAIYLNRENTNNDVLSLMSKLWLVDCLGQERFIGEKEVVSDKPKDSVLLGSLVVSVLHTEKTDVLQGDVLTISCSLSASYRLNLLKIREAETEKSILCFGTLSSDLEKLYNTKKDCDVVFKVENTEFCAHRTILSARSPQLVSMFNRSAQENSSEVNIACPPSIKAAIFGDVLYYIYTGKIRGMTSSTAIQLYTAAEVYSLYELKDICRNFLTSTLTTENVFDVADAAYTYADPPLKEEVQNFIAKNVTEVMKSDDWKNFRVKKCVFANQLLTEVLFRMKNKS